MVADVLADVTVRDVYIYIYKKKQRIYILKETAFLFFVFGL